MNNNETNTKNRIEIITAELANCQWRLEQAIRADERKTATKQWRQYARDLAASEVKKANDAAAKKAAEDHQAWQEKLVRLFEDRNGEETNGQRQPNPIRAQHHRIMGILRDGFIARPTLAGLLGVSRETVSGYLEDLRQNGIVVEKKRISHGKYRVLYRLTDKAA